MQALGLTLPCEDVLMQLCVGVEYMPEPRFCMRLKKCILRRFILRESATRFLVHVVGDGLLKSQESN